MFNIGTVCGDHGTMREGFEHALTSTRLRWTCSHRRFRDGRCSRCLLVVDVDPSFHDTVPRTP